MHHLHTVTIVSSNLTITTKVLLIELYTLVYEWRAVVYTAREFYTLVTQLEDVLLSKGRC